VVARGGAGAPRCDTAIDSLTAALVARCSVSAAGMADRLGSRAGVGVHAA
jgi:hypothetical protein